MTSKIVLSFCLFLFLFLFLFFCFFLLSVSIFYIVCISHMYFSPIVHQFSFYVRNQERFCTVTHLHTDTAWSSSQIAICFILVWIVRYLEVSVIVVCEIFKTQDVYSCVNLVLVTMLWDSKRGVYDTKCKLKHSKIVVCSQFIF